VPLNVLAMEVTLETFHASSGWLKEEARLNVQYMVVTLETSHAEMSSLKLYLKLNKLTMCLSDTALTFHSPISPNSSRARCWELGSHHMLTAWRMFLSVRGVFGCSQHTHLVIMAPPSHASTWLHGMCARGACIVLSAPSGTQSQTPWRSPRYLVIWWGMVGCSQHIYTYSGHADTMK